MDHFTAHRLQFDVEVRAPLELNAHQGSALRGALFHALRRRFCTNSTAEECRFCPLNLACPVCTLVSTLRPESDRGADVPRPYTVQPPLAAAQNGEDVVRYEAGQTFSFGLTLFAQALQLFPYVIMAIHGVDGSFPGGLGRKVADNGWQRGSFAVRCVTALNPLTGEHHEVLNGQSQGRRQVNVPDAPITHAQVLAVAGATSSPRHVTLDFLTPTRLIQRERLVQPADLTFRVVLQRLLDRLEHLSRDFSDTPLQVDFPALLQAADRVRPAANDTRWVELSSYSTRQRRATPIGGLVGTATFEADTSAELAPFLPWLIWGQFVHVGKDAVKGNGWYRLSWE